MEPWLQPLSAARFGHLRQALATIDKDKGFSLAGEELLPLGLPAVDAALGGGLACGALHELAPAAPAQFGTALGFALAWRPCARGGRAQGGYVLRAVHPDRFRGARSGRALRPRARCLRPADGAADRAAGAASGRCAVGLRGGAEIPWRRDRDRRIAGGRRSRRLHRDAAADARGARRWRARTCCCGTGRCRSRPRPRPAGRSPPRRARPTVSAVSGAPPSIFPEP